MAKRRLWLSALMLTVTVIVIAAVACSSAFAATVSGTHSADGASVSWALDDSTGVLTISGTGDMANSTLQSVAPWYDYRESVTSVVIQSGVTSVGDYAFRGFSNLTSVTISPSVTRIGENAFSRCISLTTISIPDSVTEIGRNAFSICSALETVSLGSGVQTIGEAAFMYCGNIESISVSSSNATYKVTSNCLIDKTTNTLVLGCKNSTIPSSVVYIGSYAFHYAQGLTSINIPDGVISIGEHAFHYCSSLTDVTMGDTVQSIDAWAFACCTALESVELSEALRTIGDRCFNYCPALASVTIPDNVTSMGSGSFYYCSGLTTVELPASLIKLGSSSFYACNKLESLSFLSKNVTISDTTIPKTVLIYGYDGSSAHIYAKKQGHTFEAFPGGTSDDGLAWSISPSGGLVISGIGDMADYTSGSAPWSEYLTTITSVSIEKGVTRIGTYAFAGCTALSKVSIAPTVTEIASYAFSGCSSLVEIEIPKSVEMVGVAAFYNCSALANVYFLSADSVVGDNANTLPAAAVIHSFEVSRAKDYADSYNRTFEVLEGTKGVGEDGLSWELKPDGELTVSGNGAMDDYTDSLAPWLSEWGGELNFDDMDEFTSETLIGHSPLSEFNSYLSGSYSMDNDGDEAHGNYIRHSGSTSTVTIFDPSGFMNTEKFVISFDYRMDGNPNSAGILSLNDRTMSTDNEMRVLSTMVESESDKTGKIMFGKAEATGGVTIVSGIDYNNPTWISFFIVVDPLTHNYEIYVDGVLKLYTVTDPTAAGGHLAWYLSADGTFTSHTGANYGTTQSPYTNVDNMIRGIYLFHYNTSDYSFDNLSIRPLSDIQKVTVGEGVTSIGAHAFENCIDLTEAVLPTTITAVGERAFYMTSLESIELSLKSAEIYDSADTLPAATVIKAPQRSNAASYAEKYGRTFEATQSDLAEGTCGDGLTWYLTDEFDLFIEGTGAMTDYSEGTAPWYEHLENIHSVKIASGVTTIGDYAFYGCSAVKSIEILGAVESVGDFAFSGTAIESISLPDALTSIGEYAFADCVSLTSITVPSSVTEIAKATFNGCSALVSVELPAGLKTIGGSAFGDCVALSDVTIPSGVTTIGIYAFHNCEALQNVTLPSGLTSISESTFEGSGLASITFHSNIANIGTRAFADCAGLTAVEIPATLEQIGEQAFDGCANLASISFASRTIEIYDSADTLPETTVIRAPSYSNASAYAEKYGRGFESVLIDVAEGDCGADLGWYLTADNTLFILGTGAMTDYAEGTAPWYSYRNRIETVNIASGATSIGDYAFDGCSALVSIEIPDSVKTVGDYAFRGTALETVSLPTALASIGEYAFANCGALTSFKVPSSITVIEQGTFSGCSALVTVELPSGLQTIGNSAFRNCEVLCDVSIPSGVTTIENAAFYHCEALASVTLPTGLTVINESVFEGSGLTSISFHSNITSIGARAFADCTGLTEVEIPATLEQIGEQAFDGCDDLASVTFASATTVIYDGEGTLPANATVYANSNSTAVAYAVKYGLTFVPSNISASGTCGTGLSWLLTDDNTLIISGTGDMTNYKSGTAPWYSYRTQVTSVVIQNGVTAVGAYAFQNFTVLTDVSLPDSLLTIGARAFWSCKKLATVDIPASVEAVNSYAFNNCTGLTDIYFYSEATRIASSSSTLPATATIHCFSGSLAEEYATKFGRTVEEILLSKATGICGENLTWELFYGGRMVISGEGAMTTYSASSISPWHPDYYLDITSVIIEEGVTSVDRCAFTGCVNLQTVSLPKTLLTIGVDAFSRCTSLASVEIPASVTGISAYAFYGCSEMTDITFQSKSTTIFQSVNTLPTNATIHCIGGSRAEAYAKTFGRKVDAKVVSEATGVCGENLTWELFSDGKLVISGQGAMTTYSASSRSPWYPKYYRSITSVIIEEGVTSVDRCAFSGCVNLKTVSLPSTLATIGVDAFSNCTSLVSVEIPASVTGISAYAFYGCSAMTDITIRSRYTRVFQSANTLPANATIQCTIGSRAEAYANSFERTIKTVVFSEATGVCGENLTWELFSDGKLVISGQGAMTTYSASSISPWYPNYYQKITSIVIEDGVTSVDRCAFSGCTNLKAVSLPNTLLTIGVDAFSRCTSLTSVEIPASVTGISAYAFYGCSALTDITFQSSDTVIFSSPNTISTTATIHCLENSKAQAYAEKFDRTWDTNVASEE